MVLVTVLFVTLGLAAVSFWDDLKGVPAVLRFLVHALAAGVLLAALGWPHVRAGSWFGYSVELPAWIGVAVLFIWITGYLNAFNFMDGINGIAGGQAVITGLGMALLAGMESGRWDSPPVLFSFALAGAAAGFLPHNFPKAKMFMGDVGSAPLGYLLAALVCWLGLADNGRLLVPLVLLHANFVLDTGITLLRRIWRGERWYAAHREHFYQRLVASGKSHAFVTGWEMALQLVVLGVVFGCSRAGPAGELIAAALVLLIWAVFFIYCELSFRAAMRAKAEVRPAGAL